MLGSGGFLLRGGNTWAGYEETPEETRLGGLLNEYADDDDGNCNFMDESNEEATAAAVPKEPDDDMVAAAVAAREEQKRQALDSTINSPLVVYPLTIVNGSLIYTGTAAATTMIGWPVARIPIGMGSVAPQILNALPTADPELLQNHCTGCCLMSVLPGIVHASPMIALLSTAAACFATTKAKKPLSSVEVPLHARYVSWMQSAIHLQQLRTAVLEGIFPFHESTQPLTIKCLDLEYKHQFRIGNQAYDARLDALYKARAPLEQHVVAWSEHALWYLHLLEHFLWNALVSPYPNGPLLETVLTPTESPSLDACPELAPQLLHDVTVFFKHKYELAPDCGLRDPETILPALKARNEQTYKGWVPISYLQSYMAYLQDEDSEYKSN